MAASGVRNSWETLATKSRRTFSRRSKSVMSWRIAIAPWVPAVESGAACTSKERPSAPGNCRCQRALCLVRTTLASVSRNSVSRTHSMSGVPMVGILPPTMRTSAWFEKVTCRLSSTASTPSAMAPRIASRWAASIECVRPGSAFVPPFGVRRDPARRAGPHCCHPTFRRGSAGIPQIPGCGLHVCPVRGKTTMRTRRTPAAPGAPARLIHSFQASAATAPHRPRRRLQLVQQLQTSAAGLDCEIFGALRRGYWHCIMT